MEEWRWYLCGGDGRDEDHSLAALPQAKFMLLTEGNVKNHTAGIQKNGEHFQFYKNIYHRATFIYSCWPFASYFLSVFSRYLSILYYHQ